MVRINAKDDYYEVLELNIEGMKTDSVIFTESRVDPETVSDKLHIYEVREDGYGELRAIEPGPIKVNFGGTLISIDEIPMNEGEDKHIPLTEDNLGYEGWECGYEDYVNYMEYLETTADEEPLSFAEWDDTLNH